MAMTKRNIAGKILDSMFLPIRALFIQDDSKWGLSSLRDERMRAVDGFSKGRILDVGCGPHNYFIQNFVTNQESIGIDCYQYEGVVNIIEDLENIPYPDSSFNSITLNAVGGHIPKTKRESEFKEFSRLLNHRGLLIMTEGEPITQYIHHMWYHLLLKFQGKVDVDTERGMEEDEQYCMPQKEIYQYLNSYGLKLIKRKRIMWGLNNVYVAEKSN